MSWIYMAIVAASFLLTVLLVWKFKAHIPIYYHLMFLSITVGGYGYLVLANSANLEEAMLANQLTYLSGCFLPYLTMVCVANLCNIKLKIWLSRLSLGYACLLFVVTSISCRISFLQDFPYYYRSVQLKVVNGVSILDKVYGPLHTMYPAYIVLMELVCFGIVIHALFLKKKASYINSAALIFMMTVVAATYMLERSEVIKSEYELMPFAYLLAQVTIFLVLRKIQFYNVNDVFMTTISRGNQHGVVVVDEKGRFSGCDDDARAWFEELSELEIDRVIKNHSDLLDIIMDWVNGNNTEERMYIERNDRVYQIIHRVYHKKGLPKIFCVEIVDDTDKQRYIQLIDKYNETLSEEVAKKTETLQKIQDDIILSMADIVESRDGNTGGHIKRTSDVVKIFVKHLLENNIVPELNEENAKYIIKAAPLHDFGKIGVRDEVLNKPGKFEPEEYEEMKTHSAKGAVLVEKVLQNSDLLEFKSIAINVAHYHHEKWNGTGYPCQLKGTEIPFEARVMALADVFDALVSKRVYKEKFSYDKAFSIIAESLGEHFDAELGKAFLECREDLEALYDSYPQEGA